MDGQIVLSVSFRSKFTARLSSFSNFVTLDTKHLELQIEIGTKLINIFRNVMCFVCESVSD